MDLETTETNNSILLRKLLYNAVFNKNLKYHSRRFLLYFIGYGCLDEFIFMTWDEIALNMKIPSLKNMQPSVENTRRYIEYQNMMMKKADIVSNNWQQAMLAYPHLNIVKDQPIAGAGLKILRHQEEDQNRILLEGFGKKFKLLFFYKKSCPYCLDFAGVLEFFSLKYGYKVASITLDGGQIKGFKSSYNPELTKKLKVEFTPAVFAYSEDDGIAVPVAHGYLSLDLFERNVLFVAKKLLGGRG